MIRYVVGDATEPIGIGPRIIAHIVNDACAWGAGFVRTLSKRWHEPEGAYRACGRLGLRRLELGQVQYVPVSGQIVIANMCAQYGFGEDGQPPIRYDALDRCLTDVSDHARRISASVHMPRIGCGIAGGTWDAVGPIVERCMSDIDVTVYDLEKTNA